MFSAKVFFILGCTLLVATVLPVYGAGNMKQLSGADLESAKQELDNTLASSVDGHQYSDLKIISATSQVVQGIIYKYVAKVTIKGKPTELCNITLWSRPWLGPNEVKFNCAYNGHILD